MKQRHWHSDTAAVFSGCELPCCLSALICSFFTPWWTAEVSQNKPGIRSQLIWIWGIFYIVCFNFLLKIVFCFIVSGGNQIRREVGGISELRPKAADFLLERNIFLQLCNCEPVQQNNCPDRIWTLKDFGVWCIFLSHISPVHTYCWRDAQVFLISLSCLLSVSGEYLRAFNSLCSRSKFLSEWACFINNTLCISWKKCAGMLTETPQGMQSFCMQNMLKSRVRERVLLSSVIFILVIKCQHWEFSGLPIKINRR